MKRLMPLGLVLLTMGTLHAQQRTVSPHGSLAIECKTCHGSTGWTPVRVTKAFDHAKLGFKLAGAHQTATCRSCHKALDFKGVKSDCVSCHEDRHRGELGANCSRCHTARSFLDREVLMKAHQVTRFPLVGGHLGVDCSGCHRPSAQGSMQFVGTQTDCVACHQADYQTAPNHIASRFPTTCGVCHNQIAWSRAGITDHPTMPIALTGVHSGRQCNDCHTSTPYSSVKQTCDGCHHADYAGANDPDHVAAGFSITCTDCHALVAGWTGATYASHSTSPINPKQGAHAAVICTQCHTRSPYSSAPTTCDGCHHADYVGATNPTHTPANFALTCSDCHQIVAGWTGATFASHPSAPLALTGQHKLPPRTCSDCHTTSAYASVAQTCDGCHHTTYIGVTDPNHMAAGMSAFAAANCSNCHSPTKSAWTGPTWTHPTIVSPRSLRLPHEGASCADCHQVVSDYTIKSCARSGCHRNVNGP